MIKFLVLLTLLMVLFICKADMIRQRATRGISNAEINIISPIKIPAKKYRICIYDLSNSERESISNRATEILNADIARVLDTLNLTEQDQFHNANFTECYQNNANIKAGNEYLKKNCPKRSYQIQNWFRQFVLKCC
ncbi:hypothetical protein COBT_003788, partial [Conglomerata obtusa]